MNLATPKTLAEAAERYKADGNLMHIIDFIRQCLTTEFIRADEDQEKINMLYSIGARLGTNEVVAPGPMSKAQEERFKSVWESDFDQTVETIKRLGS